MLRDRMTQVTAMLRRILTEPRHELTRWQLAVRFAYDLGRYGARQLRRDRAAQMAAALAFRSLFSLVPVIVVATVATRSLMGPAAFGEAVRNLLEWMQLYNIRPNVGAPDVVGQDMLSFGQWLEDLVQQAPSINLAAIGWVGVLVLIYSAVGVMVTIENSFNTIYRAPEGRSWLRRVPMYWFVLTIGPVLMGVTLYMERHLAGLIDGAHNFAWLVWTTKLTWSFLLTWLLMFALYSLVPNTIVAKRPVMVGALVAAILIELGKRSLGAYLENALSIRQLYGSLGLIPLFMFWVYLMWLVVLFGLEVSATLQMLGGRELEELEKKRRAGGMVEPASVLPVMQTVAAAFGRGAPITPHEITDLTRVPESTVMTLLERLEQAGFVHRLVHPEEGFTLARPPEQISADLLLDVAYELVEETADTASGFLAQLREVQRSLAANTTLAALQPVSSGPAGPDSRP